MEQGSGGMNVVVSLVYLVILVLMIVSMWKIFVKAGKPGWAAIIPIYNIIVLLQVSGKPVWWIILLIIPLVNIVIFIIVSMELAVRFGLSKMWGFGMLFILAFVGYPILAFGDAKYSPPSRA